MEDKQEAYERTLERALFIIEKGPITVDAFGIHLDDSHGSFFRHLCHVCYKGSHIQELRLPKLEDSRTRPPSHDEGEDTLDTLPNLGATEPIDPYVKGRPLPYTSVLTATSSLHETRQMCVECRKKRSTVRTRGLPCMTQRIRLPERDLFVGNLLERRYAEHKSWAGTLESP